MRQSRLSKNIRRNASATCFGGWTSTEPPWLLRFKSEMMECLIDIFLSGKSIKIESNFSFSKTVYNEKENFSFRWHKWNFSRVILRFHFETSTRERGAKWENEEEATPDKQTIQRTMTSRYTRAWEWKFFYFYSKINGKSSNAAWGGVSWWVASWKF